ncbi:ankyrin repeat-containing domain protein [Aspergillus sergii]|uniref:Ankyrin repeat-containing domain protein n=1 Tax=Aspergillus sergii TaxID=1034303 RepID=A0A5N6X6P9_9EURO|nr:ankyrin repeat-containing domain protein [Aspergillus sergii]
MRNSPAWSISQSPSPARTSTVGMMMKGLDPVLAPGDPLDPCPWPISYADNDIWSQYSSGLFSADSDVLHLSQADWQNADLSDSGSWSATNSLGDLPMTLSDAPFGQPPLWTPSSDPCIFPSIIPSGDLSSENVLDIHHQPRDGIPTPPPSQPQSNPRTPQEPSHGTERVVSLLLLQRGVNVNVQDSRGQTPLHIAAQCGHLGVVRLLLTTEHIDVNARDHHGSTPLHVASEKGHVEVVQLLVAHGARLDARSGRTG